MRQLLVLAGHAEAAYMTGGSLKPVHGVMLHAILVLPLLAWLMTLTDWSEQTQRRLVLMAVAGYAFMVGVVMAVAPN